MVVTAKVMTVGCGLTRVSLCLSSLIQSTILNEPFSLVLGTRSLIRQIQNLKVFKV